MGRLDRDNGSERLLKGLSRREFLRRTGTVMLAGTAGFQLVTACAPDDEAETSEEDRPGTETTDEGAGGLTVGTQVPAADVDPVTLFSIGAILVAQTAGEYLCFPKEDYTLEPRLATDWTSNGRADEWSFQIRSGVRWQHGDELTAEDVADTFNRLVDPDVGSAAQSVLAGILSHGNVSANDDYEVVFRLDRPYGDFPYLVSAFNYNSIILPQGYQVGDFVNGEVGAGPFRITEYNTDQGIRCEANPDYWDRERPKVNSLTLEFYEDDAPMLLALQAGDIQVVPQLSFAGLRTIEDATDIDVLSNPASQYRAVHMRTDTEPFDDVRVRRAISLCVEREQLITALFEGRADQGDDHLLAPVFPGELAAEAQSRQQDYEEAEQLLAEAGYPNGIDITLTGERTFENADYAQLLAEQLAPAGIRLELDIQDQASYYGSGDNQPWLQVPLGLTAWISRGNPSQLIAPAYTCDAIWNSAAYCNPEFDEALRTFDEATSDDERRSDATDVARMMQADVPAIISYFPYELRAHRGNIQGLATGPSSHVDFGALSLE